MVWVSRPGLGRCPGPACSGSGVNAEVWSLPLGRERGNPGNEVPARVRVGRLVSREGRGESPFLRGLPLLTLFSSSSSCGRGPALLVSVSASFSAPPVCTREQRLGSEAAPGGLDFRDADPAVVGFQLAARVPESFALREPSGSGGSPERWFLRGRCWPFLTCSEWSGARACLPVCVEFLEKPEAG